MDAPVRVAGVHLAHHRIGHVVGVGDRRRNRADGAGQPGRRGDRRPVRPAPGAVRGVPGAGGDQRAAAVRRRQPGADLRGDGRPVGAGLAVRADPQRAGACAGRTGPAGVRERPDGLQQQHRPPRGPVAGRPRARRVGLRLGDRLLPGGADARRGAARAAVRRARGADTREVVRRLARRRPGVPGSGAARHRRHAGADVVGTGHVPDPVRVVRGRPAARRRPRSGSAARDSGRRRHRGRPADRRRGEPDHRCADDGAGDPDLGRVLGGDLEPAST